MFGLVSGVELMFIVLDQGAQSVMNCSTMLWNRSHVTVFNQTSVSMGVGSDFCGLAFVLLGARPADLLLITTASQIPSTRTSCCLWCIARSPSGFGTSFIQGVNIYSCGASQRALLDCIHPADPCCCDWHHHMWLLCTCSLNCMTSCATLTVTTGCGWTLFLNRD